MITGDKMEPDFSPNEVRFGSMLPFVDTFKESGAEFAAALLVRACQVNKNKWQSISLTKIQSVLQDDLKNQKEPFFTWLVNPFLKPNIHRLVKDGIVTEETIDGKPAYKFTELGFEKMKHWVLKNPVP